MQVVVVVETTIKVELLVVDLVVEVLEVLVAQQEAQLVYQEQMD